MAIPRAAAAELARRLRARRMRNSLAEFVRGAWHVLESVPLEWNWHHDAICDHVQVMLEEWRLAGLPPHEVDWLLARWERQRDGRALELVRGMRAHWLAPEGAGGCGRGRYRQRCTDLAVNVGPISLKSRIVMVFAVAWHWLEVPSWQVFCSSGTPSNVDRDSLACRDLVTSEWYLAEFAVTWSIRDDLDRVSKWGTTAGGVREARGAGSTVTGVHVDAILIDDPDDAAKVWSESERRDTWNFWQAVGNRLNDPKRPLRLIVQQNLHEEDLSTRAVRAGVKRLAIPVEFDPARRAELYTAPYGWVDPRAVLGDVLHAGRFPAEVIAAERARLGTHGFESQYNCNPRPLEGGMIRRAWFSFFRAEDVPVPHESRPTGCRGSGGELGTVVQHPAYVVRRKRTAPRRNEVAWLGLGDAVPHLDLDWVTITVDATFGSKKDTASAVGLLAVAGKEQRRFVLDDRTEPMTFHETCQAIKVLVGSWPARRVLIELKANGQSIVDELRLQLAAGQVLGPDGRPASVVVEEVEPGRDSKEARAAAMVPAIEAGQVHLPEGAPWLEKFLGELCVFPHSKRDDRVDALSQLMTHYREPGQRARWRALAGR